MSNEENREPRFLDREQADKLMASVASIQNLAQGMEERDWKIEEDDIDWLETDLSHLKTVLEKMEYTYYVE